MSSKKDSKRRLITDKNTDYLFDYFMNEDKINEQLKADGKIDTKYEHKTTEKHPASAHNKLGSQDKLSSESDSAKRDVDFSSSFSNSETGSSSSASHTPSKSPYGKKIESKPRSESKHPHREINECPLLGEKLVNDVQKYIETPEERRARAREEYSKLQDLVEKYHIVLSRPYTIDDDPDEMKAEYDMHKGRRNKNNQVKFYKRVLLNIVCGAEFLNEKYDPFAFKLKDWSKQVAADVEDDDYTEILEEIYEKYKDKGGKFAPEIKLLFMIIMSAVTFHLSQALFGPEGLNNEIKNNPNVLNKLIGGLMGGKFGGAEAEPVQSNNTKDLLEAVRRHNSTKQPEVAPPKPNADLITEEREKRLLAEQRAHHEAQMRKQNEAYLAHIEHLQKNQMPQAPFAQPQQTSQPQQYSQLLSDANRKPRFLEKPSIFESEIRESKSLPIKSSAKKPKQNLDELIETLEESTDIDIDDIIETSSKKSRKRPAIRPKRSDSITESASRKSNVVKL